MTYSRRAACYRSTTQVTSQTRTTPGILVCIIYYYYSVIQSDGNSFCGNFGPAGFNKTSVLYFFKYAYSSITLRFKMFITKFPTDSLLIILVLNAVFITIYDVKAVQDVISAKIVPIWLHHTVWSITPGSELTFITPRPVFKIINQ